MSAHPRQIVHPHMWRYLLAILLCFIASFDITWFLHTTKSDFSFFLFIVVALAAVPNFYGAVQLFNKRELSRYVFVGIAYSILVLLLYMGRSFGVGWAAAPFL